LRDAVKHYQIRFNTKAEPGDPLVWRVFEDGRERLASDVHLKVRSYTEKSEVDGVTKWNMACDGQALWMGSTVMIFKGRE
jgi:hypothetical protein